MPSDLHMHTTYSDGKLTPEELVAKAKEAGLSYMAITDHDTVGESAISMRMAFIRRGESISSPGLSSVPIIRRVKFTFWDIISIFTTASLSTSSTMSPKPAGRASVKWWKSSSSLAMKSVRRKS